MRVALFITCFNDLLFPEVGRAMVRAPAPARPRGRVPGRADVLRPDALQHRLPGRLRPAGRAASSTRSPATTRRHAVGLVRGDGPPPPRARGRGCRAAGAGLPGARRGRWRRGSYELTEFLVDVLGVTDVGARFPHTVAFHPTCHSPRLLRRRRPAHAPARRRRGPALVDLPRADGVLRVRRHVRGQERRHVGRDGRSTRSTPSLASGAEVLTAGDTSCLMHLGGLLSRRGSPVRVMHLAEILASTGAAA